MADTKTQMNPKLDLVLERVVDVPKELVWRAWTEPELMKEMVYAQAVGNRRSRN